MENVIRLKFGDMRKGYSFTEEFCEKYKHFTTEFAKYWEEKESYFKNPFQILDYVLRYNIPVDFYFDFTDEYAKSYKQIREYLEFEGAFPKPTMVNVKDLNENYQLKVRIA